MRCLEMHSIVLIQRFKIIFKNENGVMEHRVDLTLILKEILVDVNSLSYNNCFILLRSFDKFSIIAFSFERGFWKCIILWGLSLLLYYLGTKTA